MASPVIPAFAYTVVYVKDVPKSVAFYAKAFGYSVRRIDESRRWGELETGQTTIAFTPAHQHETDDLTGQVLSPKSNRERGTRSRFALIIRTLMQPSKAVENGAVAVNEPEQKEWGQKVGYVRDIDGIVVRMGSHVSQPK